MLIAIDGPAGAGKSTVARALAAHLGIGYLDSGAMYRCVALLALRSPQSDLPGLAAGARIELAADGVRLDGEDVTDQIRTAQVSSAASRVAADPDVRRALVAKQREILAAGDWVCEGRDIGTVVAPDADVKVFLTADEHERARRRAAELGAGAADVAQEIAARDRRDAAREHSPLRAAPDAAVIDCTALSVAEVVARISALAGRR